MMHKTAFLLVATGAAMSGFQPSDAQPAATPAFDLVIRHGTVFDGTGAEGIREDVGIVGDRVVALGDLSIARGRQEEDATGLFVTPGFVSVHDHSQPELYARPESLLTQGVTTAITNPDGGGPIDITRQFAGTNGLGLNYGAYLGFNSAWREVVGLDNRAATPAEMQRMRALVVAAMKAGAYGLSAGLDYKPGFWATTAQVIDVTAAAAPWRTNFPNHERVYPGNGNSSLAGMKETIEIGAKAGVMPVITHMKLQGKDHGKTAQLFAMTEQAQARGHYVGMDIYPYTYGQTALEQLLIPAWAQAGGMDAMLARFKDPALRPRIVRETQTQIDDRWGGAGSIYILDTRQELTDVIKQMGGVSPAEAVIRLLENGARRVILRYGLESDLARMLQYPLTAVSCDCGASNLPSAHPRHWGNYPRFLGHYVRDAKLMSWGEAVRKMTALPATMIGLTERGYLIPGMIADITLFDPKTVIDMSTLQQPTLRSAGIAAVIVNGRFALRGGALTSGHAGDRLVRSEHEPSRPMHFDVARTVSANGMVGGARVAVRLAQAAHGPQPSGSVELTGLADGKVLSMRPSILQTSTRWASTTGMGRWSDGRDQAITLVAEQADPFAGGKPTLTVWANGKIVLQGPLTGGAIAVTEGRAS